MVVGLLGNKSPDSNRLTLVTPKSENDVRLQAKLGNQNPTSLPVGVVSHFKHEMDNEKEKYMYLITDAALHTETNEQLVIYQNIKTKESFARPIEMFLQEVDKKKYPDIKQKYRLEKVGEYQTLPERYKIQSYQVTDEFREFCKKELGITL